jgi:hypothetical protein
MFLFGLLCAAGLIPGLVYLVILSDRYPRCAVCKSKSIVPLATRTGQRILESAGAVPLTDEVTVPHMDLLTGVVLVLVTLFALACGALLVVGIGHFTNGILTW